MHNKTELESHDNSEDSDTENCTESGGYDGDVDTESIFLPRTHLHRPFVASLTQLAKQEGT